MAYLMIGEEQSVGFSNDGREIEASYLNHPRFSFQCNYSRALHYLFIRYAPTVGYARSYTIRKCINQLLDFTVEYEKGNPADLHLNHISLLNVEVFQGFKQYIIREALPKSHPMRLKGALIKVAKSFDEGFPLLVLPACDDSKGEGYEPLSEAAFESLKSALNNNVDRIRKKLEFRREVEAALPYTAQEVLSLHSSLVVDCEFILVYARYEFAKRDSSREDSLKEFATELRQIISISSHVELTEMVASSSESAFIHLFLTFYDKHLRIPKKEFVVNPFGKKYPIKLNRWVPDQKRILKTMLAHGYPYWVDSEIYTTAYHGAKKIGLKSDIISLILNRYFHAYRKSKKFSVIEIDTFDDVLALYFPTDLDQVVIATYLMVQTGWNKETVMALDADAFEHELTGALDVTHVLITSEKNKSQGTNLPYSNPKPFMALTDKKNKYSAYNLIQLAKELSSPYLNVEREASSREDDSHNLLYAAARNSKTYPFHIPKGTLPL